MATDYGKRLKEARKNAKLTQEQLSEKTGIPQSTISTAEREGNGSTSNAILASACGVSAHWLETGDGEMAPAARLHGKSISLHPTKEEYLRPVTLEDALKILSEHLQPLDKTARRRAGALLSDLADDPESHESLGGILRAVINSANSKAA